MRVLKLILFLIVLCLLSSIGYGQSIFYLPGNATGISLSRGILTADSIVKVPTDTITTPRYSNTGNLAVKNGLFYFYSGTAWVNPASGGGTSITLTTTGTSGAATLVNDTLNIPVYSGGGGSGVQTITATAPLTGGGTGSTVTVGIQQASALQAGFVTATDYRRWDSLRAAGSTWSVQFKRNGVLAGNDSMVYLDDGSFYSPSLHSSLAGYPDLEINAPDSVIKYTDGTHFYGMKYPPLTMETNLSFPERPTLDTFATLQTARSMIPSLTGYLPYNGATANLNMGTFTVTTPTVSATNSAGVHIHGTGGMGIMIGAGGGGNITFDDYPTAVAGDSVLTTNSSGGVLRYNMKGKLANYMLYTDTVGLSNRINAKGSGTVTSIAGGYGLTGGTITTSGTFAVDSGLQSTKAWRQKGVDSLNVLIAAKGTVTSVASGFGTTFTTITATGSVVVDSNVMSTKANRQKGVDSLNVLIAARVTTVTGTSGRISSTGGTAPAIDLVTVNATPATYGGSGAIPVVTVDAYGRATTITTVAAAPGGIAAITGDLSASGTGTVTGTLTTVNATPATYGGAGAIPIVTVDSKGRVTTITTVSPTASGTVTSIQIVGANGASVTPTTAVTTSGVYTVSTTQEVVTAVTVAATYTVVSTDTRNMTVTITSLNATTTFANPTGTFAHNQALYMSINNNGTQQTLNWGSKFAAGTSSGLDALPASTAVANRWIYIQFNYNATADRWFLTGLLLGFLRP